MLKKNVREGCTGWGEGNDNVMKTRYSCMKPILRFLTGSAGGSINCRIASKTTLN